MAADTSSSNRQLSIKRIGVDKTNARIVIITGGAAFLVVFFLVASYSLLGSMTYQNRVIKAKKTAVTQLRENLTARTSLVDSYNTFASTPQNFIGGVTAGEGAQDGANSKLVLDALPSKYDFPALTASLEKIAADQKVSIESISGTDDEVAQSENSTNAPEPVVMPFNIKVKGDYASVQRIIDAFDHSIRPIQIQKMKVTGAQAELTADLTATTYYQPAKTLTISKKVVK